MYDVLKYIHNNIEKHLDLSDVANLFGYSKWHFCSKFNKYTGKSFVKYVRHYRLQLAAIDIISGIKITDVAVNYGYETLGSWQNSVVYPESIKGKPKILKFIMKGNDLLCIL